jgi:HJR/Mrr/RecB family endonuclease
LDYEKFELIIKNSFEHNGYEVVNKKHTNDYGFDFIVYDSSRNKLLIQVKKRSLSTKISINTVQQLLGAIHAYEASGGILISTSGFTASALSFSEKCNPKIEMWTMREVKKQLSRS